MQALPLSPVTNNKMPLYQKKGANVSMYQRYLADMSIFHNIPLHYNLSVEKINNSLQAIGRVRDKGEMRTHSTCLHSLSLLASPLGHTHSHVTNFFSSLRGIIPCAGRFPSSLPWKQLARLQVPTNKVCSIPSCTWLYASVHCRQTLQ